MSDKEYNGKCSVCGTLVTKIQQKMPTFRTNGDKYIYTEKTDDQNYDIFRCINCHSVIEYNWVNV